MRFSVEGLDPYIRLCALPIDPPHQSCRLMSGLSYPLIYECSSCDQETTVEQSDVQGLYLDPDSPHGPEVVLEQRGWVQGKIEETLFCPKCAVAGGVGRSKSH